MSGDVVSGLVLAQLQQLFQDMLGDVLQARLEFVLLFDFGHAPTKRIIFGKQPSIHCSVRTASQTGRRHKLRVCRYRVTSISDKPWITLHDFFPAGWLCLWHD